MEGHCVRCDVPFQLWERHVECIAGGAHLVEDWAFLEDDEDEEDYSIVAACLERGFIEGEVIA